MLSVWEDGEKLKLLQTVFKKSTLLQLIILKKGKYMVVPQKLNTDYQYLKFSLLGIHQKDENKDTDTYIHVFIEALFTIIRRQKKFGLPSWCSGEDSACRYRGHSFDSWSGKIPPALEQLSPCATTLSPRTKALQVTTTEPVLHLLKPVSLDLCSAARRHRNEKPADHQREALHASTKTHEVRYINKLLSNS